MGKGRYEIRFKALIAKGTNPRTGVSMVGFECVRIFYRNFSGKSGTQKWDINICLIIMVKYFQHVLDCWSSGSNRFEWSLWISRHRSDTQEAISIAALVPGGRSRVETGVDGRLPERMPLRCHGRGAVLISAAPRKPSRVCLSLGMLPSNEGSFRLDGRADMGKDVPTETCRKKLGQQRWHSIVE